MLSLIYLVFAILSVGLFVSGPALAYFRVLPGQVGFLLMGIGCLIGLVVALIGVVVLVRKSPARAKAAAVLGFVPAAFLVYSMVQGRGNPLINDISTELIYPPEFVHAKTLPENKDRDMTFPESNKAIIENSYSDLQPLPLLESAEAVSDRAYNLAKNHPGWTVTFFSEDEKESTFEGVAETAMFHFKDDFKVRVRKAQNGCVVDMRSKSRDGKGDLGANAKRIREFLAEIQGAPKAVSPEEKAPEK